MKKQLVKHSIKEKEKCKWFLLCRNEATTTHYHPVLGAVPICKECEAWIKRMSS